MSRPAGLLEHDRAVGCVDVPEKLDAVAEARSRIASVALRCVSGPRADRTGEH